MRASTNSNSEEGLSSASTKYYSTKLDRAGKPETLSRPFRSRLLSRIQEWCFCMLPYRAL
jgi:hypothetical protein